jgi:arylsulfate sulfotransferase
MIRNVCSANRTHRRPGLGSPNCLSANYVRRRNQSKSQSGYSRGWTDLRTIDLSVLHVVVLLVVLATTTCSYALSVLPGLSFTPGTNAPLAGVLTLTTDTDSMVSVSVNDGKKSWKRDFFDYGTNHSETLLGFKANRTNEISVTVRDQFGNTFTVAEPLPFITAPLPTDMPTFHLWTNNVKKMEPGYTLFRVGTPSLFKLDIFTVRRGYVSIVDNTGEIVWYCDLPTVGDVRQLTNGNLFFPVRMDAAFAEVNMLGQVVKIWNARYFVDPHEDCITGHGTFLYLERRLKLNTIFPSNVTDPRAPLVTTNFSYFRIVEMSAADLHAGSILNKWSLDSMLDPARFDYLAYQIPEGGVDPEHANAIIEDTRDNSIIVSLRNQDAVIKFSRSGQIKWILGPHNNWGSQWQRYLLKPVGRPFEWNYGQHAPVFTPQGTLLLFDNGNCRAEPFDPQVADKANYSRAVEFRIDDANMQVSQMWQYADTNTDRLYAGTLGNASWLPQTGNVLVTFGCVTYENGAHPDPVAPNATIARIKEVTHEANPSVVFDLELSDPDNTNSKSQGYEVYRSYRIPDLYSHPTNPVAGPSVLLDGDRQSSGFQPTRP